MAKVRGTHASPGVYTNIVDLSYAAQTAGITKLGLVGETTMGPAFEPMPVTDWADFRAKFGGTSTETFYGSKYPKYELPYIAKSYLEVSDQLQVCRVLGLSGYNAGPAFVITASDSSNTKRYVVAVIRSRGTFDNAPSSTNYCQNGSSNYDRMSFYVDGIILHPYTSPARLDQCSSSPSSSQSQPTISSTLSDLGTFRMEALKNSTTIWTGVVSFNKWSNDYIYNVLGNSPEMKDGDNAPIYVEEVYDNALLKLVEEGEVTTITITTVQFGESVMSAIAEPVTDLVTVKSADLSRRHVGQTFLADKSYTSTGSSYFYLNYGQDGKISEAVKNPLVAGDVYEVVEYEKGGSTRYCYVKLMAGEKAVKLSQPLNAATYQDGNGYWYFFYSNGEQISYGQFTSVVNQVASACDVSASSINTGPNFANKISTSSCANDIVSPTFYCLSQMNNVVPAVMVRSYGYYFAMVSASKAAPYYGLEDYHSQFRCASTPWVVSELKGDGSNMQVKKLFRLHTISDGKASNKQIKVTISDVRPDEGLFNLQIRDYFDTDANPVVLESYKNLTMEPGNPNYIGLQIGTLDGSYETMSNYVLAEVIENEMTRTCVPCGFLGYPVRNYYNASSTAGSQQSIAQALNNVVVPYNTNYNDDINDRKQFFGMSDIDGVHAVDGDLFNYKGVAAYSLEDYTHGFTNAFHLDSTISKALTSVQSSFKLTVDGVDATSAITWTTVNPSFAFPYTHSPKIGSEEDMEGCLFENKKLRKFTFYPYGGFDGWDENRTSRTNTDGYKYNKYKGFINNGQGYAFSKVLNPESLALDTNAITTDYYAYLAGANQFEIPEKYNINLFATPGIDYVNNNYLVGEILEMIEDKRGDSLYVVTTPDKPAGMSDDVSSMYTPEDAVDNLEASGIDTYYACTYYPWIKYFDSDNSMYINLPATKDVLRNMADVDNKRYPWIAPAGIERGNVDCKKMHFFAKQDDEDVLYEGLINPLKTFANEGVKVWGNKTMYTADTPMNRVNTVRLVLYMRTLITKAANKLLFDQNDTVLKNQLEDIINPILTQIKAGRGIYKYKLVTSQTPEQIDAHEISGKLWIAPTPALEYINLSFIVTPYQVSFDEM